ncbi:hypothetical protein ACIPX0_26415 [Streptomyces sp. NPDC090075]|uniref:hypothetical protein n=1 Tax=Streptomyces sp. NPDC090075 TaxID=3365937 RepID=UPI00382A1AE5
MVGTDAACAGTDQDLWESVPMEPVGWATVAVAAIFGAFHVVNFVIKQLETTLRHLKGLVRATKELRREIKKP